MVCFHVVYGEWNCEIKPIENHEDRSCKINIGYPVFYFQKFGHVSPGHKNDLKNSSQPASLPPPPKLQMLSESRLPFCNLKCQITKYVTWNILPAKSYSTKHLSSTFLSRSSMISCDCLLFYNRHKYKTVLIILSQERSYNLAQILWREKNEKLKTVDKRFPFLVLLLRSFVTPKILMPIIHFMRKRRQLIRLTRHTLKTPLPFKVKIAKNLKFMCKNIPCRSKSG